MREFAHPWGQNSIIVRFEPSTESKNAPTVVIGAHQDSTNQFPFLPAP
jgi:leucyl aminopeptidase